MKKVILTVIAGQLFTKALNADGSPKLDKNGKEFGYLRVENPSHVDLKYAYNSGGVKRGASALIAMTVEAWEKAKNFYKEGMEIEGNVVIVDSLTKELGSRPKMAGAGENAEALTLDGKQIYRRTEFDPTCTKEDVIIRHNNEIKGSAVAQKAAEAALNA